MGKPYVLLGVFIGRWDYIVGLGWSTKLGVVRMTSGFESSGWVFHIIFCVFGVTTSSLAFFYESTLLLS